MVQLVDVIGHLGSVQKFVIVNLVAIRRWHSTLLQTLLIMNRPNQLLVKFQDSNTVIQSIVHVKDSLTIHSRQLEISDEIGNDDCIKGTPGVKKEEEDWLLEDELGILDGFSNKKGGKLMT